MLDIIRSNSQNFGVKVAFGVIILVFVFWGIGSFTDTGSVNVVGTVNDEPITFQQFETAYRSAEEGAAQNSPGRKWTAEEKQNLGRQVFQNLVSETLIRQEAERGRIGITPLELHRYVSDLKVFQDEKGRFDPERYKNILAGRRQTPAAFETDISRRLLQDRIVNFVGGGVWTDALEARARFNFIRQQRVLDYFFLPASAAGGTAEIKDDQIAAFYEAHRQDYGIPQKADVQYIVVDPLKIVKPESVSPEAAKAWYDKNISYFTEPESVEVSHILVSVSSSAPQEEAAQAERKALELKKQIDGGADFARVADANNPPNAADKGGYVGWITAGKTVPEFEKAAFAAEKGKVTEPVRSQFGWHLILVKDRKAARVKAFPDAEQEVRQTLASEEGKRRLADVLDTLTEENILGKPLADSARAQGLTAESSGLCTREALQEKLHVKPEGAGAIMAAAAGQPVDVPLEAGDSYVIVRVTAVEPASFRPLAEVKEDVAARIRAERGLDLAREKLAAMLKSAQEGKLSDADRKGFKTSGPVQRDAVPAGFLPQDDLSRAIFAAVPGDWLPGVYSVATEKEQGALICRVVRVQDPTDKEWQQFESIMTGLVQRERLDGLMQVFLENLASRSKVLIRNADIIDRKNM